MPRQFLEDLGCPREIKRDRPLLAEYLVLLEDYPTRAFVQGCVLGKKLCEAKALECLDKGVHCEPGEEKSLLKVVELLVASVGLHALLLLGKLVVCEFSRV